MVEYNRKCCYCLKGLKTCVKHGNFKSWSNSHKKCYRLYNGCREDEDIIKYNKLVYFHNKGEGFKGTEDKILNLIEIIKKK